MAQGTEPGTPGDHGPRDPAPPRVSRGRRLAGTIQDYLAVGYLYLLILGIASDSIFYGTVGVNIIRYSTILDVLLSPIVHLTSQLAFPVVIFGIPLFGFLAMRVLARRAGGRIRVRLGGSDHLVDPMAFWVGMSATVILSAYVGLGMGGGQALKQSLADGSSRPNHRITFQDNAVLEVRLVGSNSTFAFYVVPGGQVVTISPIHENIRSIERFTADSSPSASE